MKLQSKEALVIHSLSDYQSFSPVLRAELLQIAERVDRQYRDRAELLAVLKECVECLPHVGEVGLEAVGHIRRAEQAEDRARAAISKAESTN